MKSAPCQRQTRLPRPLALGLVLTASLWGCDDASDVRGPTARYDAAVHLDGSTLDAGRPDLNTVADAAPDGSDAAPTDADTTDLETPDAEGSDAEVSDAAPPDLGPPPEAPLGLNDVSILLPGVGEPPDYRSLPPVNGPGRGGPLLPRSVFDKLPPLAPDPMGGGVHYAGLRVVGIRFDGCFRGHLDDACQPQIRLVAQPLNRDGGLLDAAIHLFYPVNETTFRSLVNALRRLRALATDTDVDAPLSAHPTLSAEGLDGPYGTALLDLVLSEAGAARLRRVTFMTREPVRPDRWVFGGLEVLAPLNTPPETENIRIAEIDEIRQSVTLNPPTPPDYRYIVSPTGTVHGDPSPLFTAPLAAAATPEARAAALETLHTVENPRLVAVDEAQCVVCHLSRFARTETERLYGALDTPSRYTEPAANLTLTDETLHQPRSLRAFGWFEGHPSISPRAVHETAEALLHIEATWPAR